MSIRPLEALRHRVRGPAGGAAPDRPWDSWLEALEGGRLAEIDAACEGAGPEAFALFRDLDTDIWAVLLTKHYDAYPNIRALLPDVPEPALQESWNGASGARLAAQGAAFYDKTRARYAQHGPRPLADGNVLDFGCGWGRLTRFFARDVAPGALYGCDPVEEILEECRRSRVPATLARTDFVPERVPFDHPFDLAFAFSVFTHLSEAAHLACLRALHGAIRPGGILAVTVRPPEYLEFAPAMHPLRESEDAYLFVPHETDGHPQYAGGEMTYGETVITLPYVRERWSELFELLDTDLVLDDPYQVLLTLRRR